VLDGHLVPGVTAQFIRGCRERPCAYDSDFARPALIPAPRPWHGD
jgi:hypothetical protein